MTSITMEVILGIICTTILITLATTVTERIQIMQVPTLLMDTTRFIMLTITPDTTTPFTGFS